MSQTFIYAIYCPNKQQVKIGYASDPIKRLATLQCGTTDRLDLLFCFSGGLQEEKQLHCLLEENNVSGEWFTYNKLTLDVLHKFYSINFPKVEDESEQVNAVVLDAAILEVAYNTPKKFTISELKKKLPSLRRRTKDIEALLLENGWTFIQYQNSRVKYFNREN